MKALARRDFFKASALTTGGLLLGTWTQAAGADSEEDSAFSPNAFIKIPSEGKIVLISHIPDMGQGVKTSLPMLIAEELEVAWDQIMIETAPRDEKIYGRQSAGGSQSVRVNYKRLRQLGAAARQMFITAAAQEWGVPAAQCQASEGKIIHEASQKTLSYQELAAKASQLQPPKPGQVQLKNSSDFKIIGQRIGGVDNESIVTGQLRYGIDQVQPGMKYASFLRCPVFGGTFKSANLGEVKALPGVSDAFVVDGIGGANVLSPGVAVIADSTWQAMKALEALKVDWDLGPNANHSSVRYAEAAQQHIQKGPAGRPGAKSLDFGPEPLDVTYQLPLLAHNTLEPQNCTGVFKDGHFELWAPTQNAARAFQGFKQAFKVSEDKVTIHVTRVGGGFGRRINSDYMIECGAIAKHLNGTPVKLTWTREQDLQHDFYRNGSWHHFRGAVNDAGAISAWSDHFVTMGPNARKPGTAAKLNPSEFPSGFVKNFQISQSVIPTHIPFGYLRAPGSNGISFAVQSFIDELAHKAGVDPLEFRLTLLGDKAKVGRYEANRMKAALQAATEKAQWGKPLPKGSAQGVAFHFCHKGYVAVVAEVTVTPEGQLTVDKLTAGIDVGPILNPSGAEQQAHGSMLDGLSVALYQKVVIADGAVQNTNYHDHPLVRIPEVGQLETVFVDSKAEPTGMGEPVLPPTIPAVCNAIFAASGKRVRSLPISDHDLSWG